MSDRTHAHWPLASSLPSEAILPMAVPPSPPPQPPLRWQALASRSGPFALQSPRCASSCACVCMQRASAPSPQSPRVSPWLPATLRTYMPHVHVRMQVGELTPASFAAYAATNLPMLIAFVPPTSGVAADRQAADPVDLASARAEARALRGVLTAVAGRFRGKLCVILVPFDSHTHTVDSLQSHPMCATCIHTVLAHHAFTPYVRPPCADVWSRAMA